MSEEVEVGDGVEFVRCFFDTEAAIEIGTDGDVEAGACELADVVDVVGGEFEGEIGTRGEGEMVGGVEHFVVEGDADEAGARGDGFDVGVGDLAHAWDKGAAVAVAGDDGAGEEIEGLGDGLIGEVREIEDHFEVGHGL